MKAIAMKMTQKQFDSVKSELVGIESITGFDRHSYLVTNYGNNLGMVSNISPEEKNSHNRTVYGHFDKDILFDALDIKLKQSELHEKITDVIECAKCLGLNAKVIFE